VVFTNTHNTHGHDRQITKPRKRISCEAFLVYQMGYRALRARLKTNHDCRATDGTLTADWILSPESGRKPLFVLSIEVLKGDEGGN